MADTIGPDGLTHTERPSCDCKPGRSSGDKIHMPSCSLFHHLLLLVVSRLAAERLTHAETRADKLFAEGERDAARHDLVIAEDHLKAASAAHLEAESELAETRARAEKAEAERGRLRLDLDAYRTAREAFGKTVQGGARAHDAAAALMVERGRLRAALEPFARFCAAFDGQQNNLAQRDTDVIYAFNMVEITLGDVRRARALLGEVKP